MGDTVPDPSRERSSDRGFSEKLNNFADYSMQKLGNLYKYSPTRSKHLDYIGHLSNNCGDLYFDWLVCADRVGLQNSAKMCRKSFEDYKECKFNKKTNERLAIMDKARIRQNRPEIPMVQIDAEKYPEGFNTERS